MHPCFKNEIMAKDAMKILLKKKKTRVANINVKQSRLHNEEFCQE